MYFNWGNWILSALQPKQDDRTRQCLSCPVALLWTTDKRARKKKKKMFSSSTSKTCERARGEWTVNWAVVCMFISLYWPLFSVTRRVGRHWMTHAVPSPEMAVLLKLCLLSSSSFSWKRHCSKWQHWNLRGRWAWRSTGYIDWLPAGSCSFSCSAVTVLPLPIITVRWMTAWPPSWAVGTSGTHFAFHLLYKTEGECTVMVLVMVVLLVLSPTSQSYEEIINTAYSLNGHSQISSVQLHFLLTLDKRG